MTDVPQMFATGAMQAMVTSSATGTSTKAWEFVKNYYKTSAFHPKNVVVVNQRGFSRLPKDQQGALVKAAAAAEKRGWEMSKAREKEGDETLAKNGMSVREPDAKMKAERYKQFTEYLASVPAVVAADWFQLNDEPPSGRGDGAMTMRETAEVLGTKVRRMPLRLGQAIPGPALVAEGSDRASPASRAQRFRL